MTMTVDELWQTRAAAWELAALSLRYPGAELAGAAGGSYGVSGHQP